MAKRDEKRKRNSRRRIREAEKEGQVPYEETVLSDEEELDAIWDRIANSENPPTNTTYDLND